MSACQCQAASKVIYDAPHRGPHSDLRLVAVGSCLVVDLIRPFFYWWSSPGRGPHANPFFIHGSCEARPARRRRGESTQPSSSSPSCTCLPPPRRLSPSPPVRRPFPRLRMAAPPSAGAAAIPFSRIHPRPSAQPHAAGDYAHCRPFPRAP
jgi:hypothetical protein